MCIRFSHARRTRAALILASLFLAALGLARWLLADLPSPADLPRRAPHSTTKIVDRQGRLLYEILDPLTGQRTVLPLHEFPPALRQATIATEDASFYQNPGLDPLGILRAAYLNTVEGKTVSGGSTITQQVARLCLLSADERGERTLRRKIREAVLAWQIAQTYSKDEVLALYLNQVYYGNLAHGAEAAAQVYFGVPARDLDLAQCAFLAGLPQSPAAYDPFTNLDAARARQRVVLGLMAKRGMITPQQAERAGQEPLRLAGHGSGIAAPHFVHLVRSQLETRYSPEVLVAGGWRITTTLDLDLQTYAESVVRRHLAEMRAHDAHNAAVVVLDPTTGQVLALVGSPDYFDAAIAGAVNAATSARQPGSALKPLAYALAFSRDWTPATVVYDVPTTFRTREGGAYRPQNYDYEFHGPVSLRQALACSYNVPAVLVLDHVGDADLVDLGHALGLTTLEHRGDYGLSLVLGGGEVRLLDLTSAYGTLATGGLRRDPVTVLAVADSQGREFYRTQEPSARRVLDPQTCYQVTDILADHAARAPAFGDGGPLWLPWPAAVKTGTTTDWRDNWTVGYTTQRVVGVWVGNADNQPMQHASGVTGAAPIWHDIMLTLGPPSPWKGEPLASLREATRGDTRSVLWRGWGFQEPPGLTRRQVCATSGLLPGPACTHRHEEVFQAGTQPTETCAEHVRLAVDARTGDLAGPHTPPDLVAEQAFWLAPPPLRDWAIAQGLPQPPTGSSTPAAVTPSVLLVQPPHGAVLLLSPDVPRDHQRLEVTAHAGGPSDPVAVTFYIDDVPLDTCAAPPYRALWTLSLGQHTFRAEAIWSNGQRASSERVTIHVEPWLRE